MPRAQSPKQRARIFRCSCCYPPLYFFAAVMLDFDGDFIAYDQQLTGDSAVIE
jgi:hypothetical protein